MERVSRRYAIKCGLASLGWAGLVQRRWQWLSLGLGSSTAYGQTLQRVCVSVHGPDGRHLPDPAIVELQPAGGGPSITLDAEGTVPPVLYGGQVPEGDYVLTVGNVGTLRASSCAVSVVGEQRGCIGVYMQPQGTPCLVYRIGRSRIPFIFRPTVLGVLVPGRLANPGTAQKFANILASDRINPYPAVPADPQSWIAANGYIWFFSIDLPVGARDSEVARRRQKAAESIRDALRGELRLENIPSSAVRIGLPVQLEPGIVKILDTRYVVRLTKDSGWRAVRKLIRLRGTNARVLRKLSYAKNAFLVEFLDHDHPGHLRQVEAWLQSGPCLYIEPDLVVELQQHACPAALPNDPVAPCQEGLARQCVPDAWSLLETQIGADHKYGHSDICVGLIEGPADPKHADIDMEQIKHCELFNWDPSLSCYRQLGTGKGLKSEASQDEGMVNHGTWVFGVGGAMTGNLNAVAGIAPTVAKVIAVPPSGLAITKYCEIVSWLAGLGVPTGSSAPLLGTDGNPPAADVINCSHGVGSMPTPAQVCDAFAHVTHEGRDGKGTLLVYSAGNDNSLIENVQAFADDPHVITVGATMIAAPPGAPAGDPVEKRWLQPTADGSGYDGSNYGHSLDLCAIGGSVPTLHTDPAAAYVCASTSNPKVSAFSGTSLAAPAVSAACALMLTANSDLRWCDLRKLLRNSARRPLNAADPNLQESDSSWAQYRHLKFGSGRLDVLAAVQGAKDFTSGTGLQNCEVQCNYTAVCTTADDGCQQR